MFETGTRVRGGSDLATKFLPSLRDWCCNPGDRTVALAITTTKTYSTAVVLSTSHVLNLVASESRRLIHLHAYTPRIWAFTGYRSLSTDRLRITLHEWRSQWATNCSIASAVEERNFNINGLPANRLTRIGRNHTHRFRQTDFSHVKQKQGLSALEKHDTQILTV